MLVSHSFVSETIREGKFMRLLSVLITVAITSTLARAQDSMPIETVVKVKEATTFIQTSVDSIDDGPSMSGSGFVIRTEGTTGFIVTNHHVIFPPIGSKMFDTRPTTKVYFRSGTKAEVRAVAEIVATSPERDLALLRVTNVANLPQPLALASKIAPFETMTVYIFGFPFGEKLSMGKGHPPVNVGRGQVSSLRHNEDEQLTSILLDGALNPGNSGGPVVDAKGTLIGVSRATIRGANIGFTIAVPELIAMLNGRADEISLAIGSRKAGTAELTIQIALLDPLSRIKSARLLHTRGEAVFSKTKRKAPLAPPEADRDDEPRAAPHKESAEPSFTFGPIEGAETLPLSIDRFQATAKLTIPLTDQDVAFWCQVSFVDGSGQTVHTKPVRSFLGAVKSKESEKESNGLNYWGSLVDPDGDSLVTMVHGNLKVDVPGTLHDLNIDIGKNNAPRIVQEVEGDFVATVNVTGSFEPGAVRTGPKSFPYNGGGLLAWSDEGNYIRLERAAMYGRNNRVVGLVLFESRVQGTKDETNNKGGRDPRQDLWLRLERHGKTIAGFLSTDAKNWEPLEPMEVDWPSRLKVGVDAINSCGDRMNVRFQNYSLKKK
jgi:regulation of enolase protein 1 (concanavalin A-like superfamily)